MADLVHLEMGLPVWTGTGRSTTTFSKIYSVKNEKTFVDGLFSGPKRSYDDFKRQIPADVTATLDSLREFCLSLGDNVVEDIRAHRIVFGKSLSFRWFADLEPDGQSVIIKIQRSRKEPFKTILVKSGQNLDEIKSSILDAYNTIH